MTKKNFAIILNGCGSMDGSEIHESVSVMYAIDKLGSKYQIFAPDIEQYQVVDHLNKKVMPEKRNCMIEAARIARGNVMNIKNLKASDYDALIFPGGSGSAYNIFTYMTDGENFSVRDDISHIILDFHKEGKPIGAMCISPLMIAKVINGVTVTMGKDIVTSKIVESMGGHVCPANNGEVVFDKKNNIFSVPCYMLNARISDIFEDAVQLISNILNH